MLEKLDDITINDRNFQLHSALYDFHAEHTFYCDNWGSLIESYVELKQQLLQQLNEQVRPHLTDDEWTMLIIQVNSCPEIVNYLPQSSESFVPF